MQVRTPLAALAALLAPCCSSGGDGDTGRNQGDGLCLAACEQTSSLPCSILLDTCIEGCEAARDQQAEFGCSDLFTIALECSATAPASCASNGVLVQPECNKAIDDYIDCSGCESKGGPMAGDACSAADDGKKICWNCNTLLGCQASGGTFTWQKLRDCDSGCEDGDAGSEPWCP